MYREVIYTHCSKGTDINNGREQSGNGFKVYATDASIINSPEIDIPFFANAIAKKQSFDKAKLMDDAYLYYVPDSMECFLIGFHPFKPCNTQGDTRYGKYINQVFLGAFKQTYPCETFNSPELWDAKMRGLDYYYITDPPGSLPMRTIINGISERYENIGKFISEGRREALKSAVAYLISQYEKPAAERKFLVIVDECAENIENWITAIEYAFSPRICASVPFATRMDSFERENVYTVNKISGRSEVRPNYQDPNQEKRFRAMLVGVDLRDVTNVSNVRSMINLPYIVLDGRTKEPLPDVDISNSYFELISSFDAEHREFCKVFLQNLGNVKDVPNSEIIGICDIFKRLKSVKRLMVSEVLATMDKLMSLIPDDIIVGDVYSAVSNELPRLIKEHAASAFVLYNKYLIPMAERSRDTEVRERFYDAIKTVLISCRPDESGKDSASAIIRELSQLMTSEKIHELIIKFADEEQNDIVVDFLLECLIHTDKTVIASDESAFKLCEKLNNVHLGRYGTNVLLERIKAIQTIDAFGRFKVSAQKASWLNEAQKNELESVIHKRVKALINAEREAFKSNEKTEQFCILLNQNGFGTNEITKIVLVLRLNEIKTAYEIVGFKNLKPLSWIQPTDREALLSAIDVDTENIVRKEFEWNQTLFLTSGETFRYCEALRLLGLKDYIKIALSKRLATMINSGQDMTEIANLLNGMSKSGLISIDEYKVLSEQIEKEITAKNQRAIDEKRSKSFFGKISRLSGNKDRK